MGRVGSAHCKCGYDQENLIFGGGRGSAREFAGYPYLCRSCNAVFTGNLYKESSSCKQCESTDTTSYEDATLWEPKDSADREAEFSYSLYIGPAPLNAPAPLPMPEIHREPPKGLFQVLWRKLTGGEPEHLTMSFVDAESLPLSIHREIVLHSGGYLCPKCDEFSLSFVAFIYFR